MKLFDDLGTIDKRKIREAVIPELDRYRTYKMLANVGEDKRNYCEAVEAAISKLPKAERFLIQERYTGQECGEMTDFQVYNFKFDPPISAMTFHKIRNRALVKLSLALNIETGVYIDI